MITHEGVLKQLQNLHDDLSSLNESRLANVDRLWHILEAHLDQFKHLLNKRPRNQQSRDCILSGSITVNEEQYAINKQFQNDVIAIAAILESDEIEVAKLYMEAQNSHTMLDRPPGTYTIVNFHQRRQYLAECVRLCLQKATDMACDDDLSGPFKELMNLVVIDLDGLREGANWYWRQCLRNMTEIEIWLHAMTDRAQSDFITGSNLPPEIMEALEFQRASLFKQHESLGAIVYHLIKSNNANIDDLRFLLTKLKSYDRYDGLLVHYIPGLFALISSLGTSDNSYSQKDAKSLNDFILADKDSDQWHLRPIQAATITVWLAEYSSRLSDSSVISPIETGSIAEAEHRTQLFFESLRDGAFQMMLRLCQDVRDASWPDPIQVGFTNFLIKDALNFQVDQFEAAAFFRDILMEQLQCFVEALITNMPDCLRRIRYEEDEQRRQIQGRAQLNPSEYDLHFERFLIITSYAFDGYVQSAESFWSDTDGNFFGFLQWASQRQSTPRVAAFCEMLRSLSVGSICADGAHNFLLDEGPYPAGKIKKYAPLSWAHILNEIEFYSISIKDRYNTQQQKKQSSQTMELESPMMLESYLRLLSRICQESSIARKFILTHQSIPIHEHLLLLCSGLAESRLRACAFSALAALLTQKSRETGDALWTVLDSWMHGSFVGSPINRQASFLHSFDSADSFVYDFISTDLEEPTAFIDLLQALISPSSEINILSDDLPFPENLGAAYRMPGVEPYIDFAFGRIFAERPVELQESQQLYVLRLSCLNLAMTCLTSFNEALVVYANNSPVSVDSAMRTSSLAAYLRLHPFARAMDWFFNEKTSSVLFDCVDQEIDHIVNAGEDSIQVVCVIRGMEVMSLILALQDTYFDIIRPMIKLQSPSRRLVVENSAFISFEDAILKHFSFITKLGQYCCTGIMSLTIQSLQLLNQLSLSKKIVHPLSVGSTRLVEKSRLVTALERGNELEGIARSLMNILQLKEKELERGPSSYDVCAKKELLRFLITSMDNAYDRPNATYLLLGFEYHMRSITLADPKSFTQRRTLFHTLLDFIVESPCGYEDGVISWLIALKKDALRMMQMLCLSPASSELVISECQRNDILIQLWDQQIVVSPDTLWDGKKVQDPGFFLSDSATAYLTFLHYRNILLQCAATELIHAATNKEVSHVNHLKSTFLGNIALKGEQNSRRLTVCDMVDFLEVQIGDILALPASTFFPASDFNMCKLGGEQSRKYSVADAEQLIALRQAELWKGGQMKTHFDQQRMQADAKNILHCLYANNKRLDIEDAYLTCFTTWTQLMIVILDACDLGEAEKYSTVIRLLQFIVPRLERSFTDSAFLSITLARLGSFLLGHIKIKPEVLLEAESIEINSDDIFQLFRVALLGIQSPQATSELRDSCYAICQRYLDALCVSKQQKLTRRHAMHCIKSLGPRLVEVLCDDAYEGEWQCRTSVMLLLGTMVSVFRIAGSSYMLDTLSHLNFLELSVDMTREIASSLRQGSTNDPAQLMSFYSTMLTMVLRLCQTRRGAKQIFNAGLFTAIRDSRLFHADPDIDHKFNNTGMDVYHYQLLLLMLRIVNAIAVCQGMQNELMVTEARRFVREYGTMIMSLYNLDKQLTNATNGSDLVLKDVVDNLTAIIALSGCLEYPEVENENKTRDVFL